MHKARAYSLDGRCIEFMHTLPKHQILMENRVFELLDCSRPAVGNTVRVLEAADLVRPTDERKKNRTAVFEDDLALVRQGPESSS